MTFQFIFSRKSLFLFIIYLTFSCISENSAVQAQMLNEEKLPSPSEEKFESASELIVPWRDAGCHRRASDNKYNEPDCHLVTAEEYKSSDTLSIYNGNGYLWYSFSLTYGKSNYFLRDKKNGFQPFSTGSVPGDSKLVILRMVGESAHWYEVEVDETTQATKFISKSDPMWAKTSWDYWLHESFDLRFDIEKVKLLDKPNGQEIESTKGIKIKRAEFLKSDGDWAFVATLGEKSQGWIRWREGRNILVGCIFNAYKIPDSQNDGNTK